ncbi:MAG: DUF3021 domain-containing protein [Lachnospiraceae bacterium]|nr:DUF3021 domain-containing protein [Lachnospiraceae bacterium]
MLNRAIQRGISSFLYAVAVNVVLGCILMAIRGDSDFLPVLPEFAERFRTPVMGMLIQWLLIGLTSAAFGAWSVLLEIETWSMLKQCVLYFILTSAVWVPVGVICWGLGKYVSSFISVFLSYSVSYIVVWVVQYRNCKQAVAQINQKLKELERS